MADECQRDDHNGDGDDEDDDVEEKRVSFAFPIFYR
jgi:hypothetical protein